MNYREEPATDDSTHIDDPLSGLAERTAINPGEPFVREVLDRLDALKTTNRASFETLRGRLKAAGCRVAELDDALAALHRGAGRPVPAQAVTLIQIANSAELFHNSNNVGFADIDVNGHRETWAIRSNGFSNWLRHGYFEETGAAPTSEALNSALNTLDARALFTGPERPVYVRVGGLNGRLYLDLCDKTWRTVEITLDGWRVICDPPIRFRRPKGMLALPVPIRVGSGDKQPLAKLRSFLNVKSDADFVLVVAWTLACLSNHGPYPLLVLMGEQGCGKSSFARGLRALLDPNSTPLRALARNEHDLFISARNGHILAFDNVSSPPVWVSDALCRMATGGGYAVRQLYSDDDEMLFEATRPIVLNGIEGVVTRNDLADRSLMISLEPISEERRRPESELWAEFELERPRILGALLDAVAMGLARQSTTRLVKMPRMADFAKWVTACEPALWSVGTFASAYESNRASVVDEMIDADPIALALRDLVATENEWIGTATALLDALARKAGARAAKSRTWPTSATALGGWLRRSTTFLRKLGIDVAFSRDGKSRTRNISIRSTGGRFAADGLGPSAASAQS